MSRRTLVFISPVAGRASLPSRPSRLLSGFVEARTFDEVVMVHRMRPTSFFSRLRGGRWITRGGLVAATRRTTGGSMLIEHPWPFGRLERRFLGGLLADSAKRSGAIVVAWVCDPKSVRGVVGPSRAGRRWRVVVDAYDAWDLSPLVRGSRRLRAVADGYRAAAVSADLVFANTTAMQDRLIDLGAHNARLLQNACPPLAPREGGAHDPPAGLLYVGRIHERFDAGLAAAVATSLPETIVTIAGPVEREPAGWSALAALPNVRLPGVVGSRAALDMMRAAAALIVPHKVDDYTRSQDAMKAWDGIACGTPVISTPIPPADGWPVGLAEVCPTTEAFVAAARRAVDGELERGRADRLAFAIENQWSARVAAAMAAMGELLGGTDVQRR